jgi:hypothetical protein
VIFVQNLFAVYIYYVYKLNHNRLVFILFDMEGVHKGAFGFSNESLIHITSNVSTSSKSIKALFGRASLKNFSFGFPVSL